MASIPPNMTPRSATSEWAAVNLTAATAQTLMPMRAKPAPVTFLTARGTATWVRDVLFPQIPLPNRLVRGISAKLFLVALDPVAD
jgi:hypothetical protein